MQVPQRHARREALLGFELDGRREFQVTEIGDRVFRPGPHADEFDFRHDEPVAAGMLAHAAVQLRQRGQVEDLPLADFVTHARVPPVERFDQADDPAPAVPRERALDVVLVIGDEVRAVFGPFGPHAHVVELALEDLERRVDFGREEIAMDRDQFGLRARLEAGRGDVGHREGAGADVDVEELVEVRDRFDRFQVEAVPDVQVADVPPRVHLLPAAEDNVDLMRHEVDRGVGPGEVLGEVGGRVVFRHELELLRQILRLRRRGQRRRHEGRRPRHDRRGVLRGAAHILRQAPVGGVAVMPEGEIVDAGRGRGPAVTRSPPVRGGKRDGGVQRGIGPGIQGRRGRHGRDQRDAFRRGGGAALDRGPRADGLPGRIARAGQRPPMRPRPLQRRLHALILRADPREQRGAGLSQRGPTGGGGMGEDGIGGRILRPHGRSGGTLAAIAIREDQGNLRKWRGGGAIVIWFQRHGDPRGGGGKGMM